MGKLALIGQMGEIQSGCQIKLAECTVPDLNSLYLTLHVPDQNVSWYYCVKW